MAQGPFRNIVQAFMLGLSAAVFLAGCDTAGGGRSAQIKPITSQKIGRPYKIAGVWYRPARQPGYDRVGIASWYGEAFNGKPTANGEIFDMEKMTAAHTTLPLPSYVEVTNLGNGRTRIVRVNDRGPFVDGRLIDLSKAAARELGFLGRGLAKVRVRLIEAPGEAVASTRQLAPQPVSIDIARPVEPLVQPAVAESIVEPVTHPVMAEPISRPAIKPTQQPIAAPTITQAEITRFVVQLGTFADAGNASRLASRYQNKYPTYVLSDGDGNRVLNIVRLGPFATWGEAEQAALDARSNGLKDAKVFRNKG